MYNLNFEQFYASCQYCQDSRLNTVKHVTQPASHIAFSGFESSVINEGGIYSRAGKNLYLPICQV